jgi:hypothetical protein
VRNSPTLGTSSSYVAFTLTRISELFVVNYIPNTPVGSTNVNGSKLIKAKGQLGFLQKTKSPSRATAGGIPPPQKMVPFFRKKFAKHAKYDLTSASSEFRQGAGGQAGKMREPEIAYASTRIWPFSLAYGPAGYLWNRTSLTRIRPGKGKTEQCDKRNKKHHLYLQVYKYPKRVLVHYMATWPES